MIIGDADDGVAWQSARALPEVRGGIVKLREEIREDAPAEVPSSADQSGVDAKASQPAASAGSEHDRAGSAPRTMAHAYLPAVGPHPLRFAEPDRWPDPLPEAEGKKLAAAGALPEITVVDPDPAPRPERGQAVADNEPSPGVHRISAGEPPAGADQEPAPVGLTAGGDAGSLAVTAEMVRGFLEKIDRAAGARAVPFLPAVPGDRMVPLAQSKPAR